MRNLDWITPELGMLVVTAFIAIYTMFTARSAKNSADESKKQRINAEFEAKNSRIAADAAKESAVSAKLQVEAAQVSNNLALLKARTDYLLEANRILMDLQNTGPTDPSREAVFWKFHRYKEVAQFYFPAEYAERMNVIYGELKTTAFDLWEQTLDGEMILDSQSIDQLNESKYKQLESFTTLIDSMRDFLRTTYH